MRVVGELKSSSSTFPMHPTVIRRFAASARVACAVYLARVAHSAHGRTRAAAAALGTAACAACVGWLLAGCSPAYNWRTVNDNVAGYAIDLPAKPTLDERALDIAGTPMRMRVRAANAQEAVFAVGTIALPSDDPQLQRAVLDFLRAGLARNVGASADARATEIPLAAGGQVPGLEIDVSGNAGAGREHRTIHALLVARGKHVYQAAIIAGREPPREQVDQFFQSFKLF
jgi:hypothetical protein